MRSWIDDLILALVFMIVMGSGLLITFYLTVLYV